MRETAVATGQAGSSSFVFMASHLREHHNIFFLICTVIKRCVLVLECAPA
jgi:hypothetical protein